MSMRITSPLNGGVGHFRADRQHHVGLRDQFPTRLNTQTRAGQQWRIRRQAFAGDAGKQRCAQAFAQDLQFGTRRQCPAAGDDHRPLAALQASRRFIQHSGSGQAASGTTHHLAAPVTADRPGQHVQRHRNMHRPRPFAVEHGKGTGDQLGQIVGAQGHRRKRGDGCRDCPLILGFVQAPPAFAKAGGVVDAGDHQHRDRVGVGLTDGRRRVGDARAGDDEAHPRFAADPRVAVGHEPGALFMTGQHMADTAAGQAAIQLKGVHTGNAEHGIDPVVGQQTHQGLAASEGRG
jgi:hypothetical protein